MDFTTAAITAAAFVLGGIFNALVGAAVAEYRARQDERRKWSAERRDRVRAERLAQLDTLKRHAYGEMIYRMALLTGDRRLIEGSRVAERDLLDEWPRYDLLGDRELLADYFKLIRDLESRNPGSGFSDADFRSWAAIEGRLLRAVMLQRERILRDEPTPAVPWQQVGELEGGYEPTLRRLAASSAHKSSEATDVTD
jgi:hypothetical protein